jgi:hypothetical protein
MEKAGRMTLFELLKQKYKRFERGNINRGSAEYHLFGHTVYFIIDGFFVNQLGLPVDLYMNYLTAEDIKGIEIMFTAKYALAYDPNFIRAQIMSREISIPVFLEITTYSGHGAFIRHTPGTYLYKSIALSAPKQFYSPKYSIINKSAGMGADLRSTIYWSPNIITDSMGKANLSFYSADKPGIYNIIIEGTDMNGYVGYSQQKIRVLQGTVMK